MVWQPNLVVLPFFPFSFAKQFRSVDRVSVALAARWSLAIRGDRYAVSSSMWWPRGLLSLPPGARRDAGALMALEARQDMAGCCHLVPGFPQNPVARRAWVQTVFPLFQLSGLAHEVGVGGEGHSPSLKPGEVRTCPAIAR